MTNDLNVVQGGEGAIDHGYCTFDSGDSPFRGGLEDEKNVFIAKDISGNIYKIGISASGDVKENREDFDIQIGLAGEGQHNSKVKTWADLMLTDPVESRRDLPGHTVSLGLFDSGN